MSSGACLCNGWITGRRFQQCGRCVLACCSGEDSIEYYARCVAFHSLCYRHFRISRPPATQCLEDFLCITPCSSALPALLQEDGDAAYTHAVTLRALSLYALYMTLGSVRHRTILLRDAPDACARHAQDGCKGHKGVSLLRRCHIRARDIS